MNLTRIVCSLCRQPIPLDDLVEEAARPDARVEEIEREAAESEEQQKRLVVFVEKERLGQFDAFLCHNSQDKPEVRHLNQKLQEQGVLAWIDENRLLAGDPFVPALEYMIDNIPAALILVGANWLGRWQRQEYYAFLQRFIEYRMESGKPRLVLIPILMPSAPEKPTLPTFLRGINWIDFRKKGFEDQQSMRKLVEGIFSKHSDYLR